MDFNYYGFMYEDLKSNCLKVCLIDAPEKQHSGHKIRVAFEQNPDWYRKLCLVYPSKRKSQKRKFDTAIKRAAIIRMLESLKSGKPVKSKYIKDLKQIAQNMQEEDENLNNTPF